MEFNRVGGQQMCVLLHRILVIARLATTIGHFLSRHVVDEVDVILHRVVALVVTFIIAVFEFDCLVSNSHSFF